MAAYEDRVEIREGLAGGEMPGEKVLDEHGCEGWQLTSVTSVEVKGRIGPGDVEGMPLTFERVRS